MNVKAFLDSVAEDALRRAPRRVLIVWMPKETP